MLEEPKVGWRRRITRALMIGVLNLALMIVIPSLLFRYVAAQIPAGSLPLSEGTIIAFGGVITGLQVLGALSEGMLVSIPFESGSFVATAGYLWIAANGGIIALSARGITFVLSFQPLLYLLVLPPLFGAVRVPISYLLDQHEAARPSPDSI